MSSMHLTKFFIVGFEGKKKKKVIWTEEKVQTLPTGNFLRMTENYADFFLK